MVLLGTVSSYPELSTSIYKCLQSALWLPLLAFFCSPPSSSQSCFLCPPLPSSSLHCASRLTGTRLELHVSGASLYSLPADHQGDLLNSTSTTVHIHGCWQLVLTMASPSNGHMSGISVVPTFQSSWNLYVMSQYNSVAARNEKHLKYIKTISQHQNL
jgi:hypothetical protein